MDNPPSVVLVSGMLVENTLFQVPIKVRLKRCNLFTIVVVLGHRMEGRPGRSGDVVGLVNLEDAMEVEPLRALEVLLDRGVAGVVEFHSNAPLDTS